jgi:diacylglycerol O-acyltransferase
LPSGGRRLGRRHADEQARHGEEMMNRLSALDAAFLYLETPETPMNIGSLTIFAPSAASPDTIFQSFREHTLARLDLLPSYRRRPLMTPLGIDHPVWIDEKELDLDYHIRRRALPRPGTMEQLRSLVADLHTVLLDRERPLWQYYVIEGLEGGGFAVYIKLHHSDMDGVSGMATLPIVYDFSPDPAPLPPSTGKIPEAEGKPSFSELIGSAISDFIGQDLRLLRAGPRFAYALANVGRRAARTMRVLPDGLRLAPRTLFNVSISRERSFGTASLSLSDVKHIAKARHATVNDVVLTICGGALLRYLSAHRAVPKESLIAAVPVSLREPGHNEMNNQVAAVMCSLATDIADPLERLAAVGASTQDSKGRFIDVKQIFPTEISLVGVPLLITGLGRLARGTRAYDILPNAYNLWISNVPGPRQPIYCAGAKAVHYFPVSVAYHGAALNITAQSYLDDIEFGLTASRGVVPDVQVIADHLVEELAVLKRAVDAVSEAGAVEVIDIAAPAPPPMAAPQDAPPRPAAIAPPREPIAVVAPRVHRRKTREARKAAPRRQPVPVEKNGSP